MSIMIVLFIEMFPKCEKGKRTFKTVQTQKAEIFITGNFSFMYVYNV